MELGKIILLVDDTPANISILGEYLVDHRVKVALNGAKALSIANSDPKPDIIILDIMMPEMDGYEVCKRLKENPATSEIPIIFISAMNEVTDKVKGFQLGAVDYITKPFQVEEVKSRINTHLELNSLQKRLKNINQELEQKVIDRTAELLIAKSKAEESSRIKSYFLELMSHELRTPMNGILGFSDVLMKEIADNTQRDYAEFIHKSAKRLHNTLDSILTYSSIESGKLFVHYTEFDIMEKSQNLFKIHEIRALLKHLSITLTVSVPNLKVTMDEIMYETIFNNLLSNAIIYSDSGTISVEVINEGNNCILKVLDMGRGIPPEKMEIIFEEFRQVEEGIQRSFEGLGLGLSLVKKYINLLHGSINVESEVGKGSLFSVSLPISPHKNN